MHFLNNISIEVIVFSLVLLFCVITFGINIFIRQQITSQKQGHENRMQEILVKISALQNHFQENKIIEQQSIKRQKEFFYKIDIIKVKCFHLTKQINI